MFSFHLGVSLALQLSVYRMESFFLLPYNGLPDEFQNLCSALSFDSISHIGYLFSLLQIISKSIAELSIDSIECSTVIANKSWEEITPQTGIDIVVIIKEKNCFFLIAFMVNRHSRPCSDGCCLDCMQRVINNTCCCQQYQRIPLQWNAVMMNAKKRYCSFYFNSA